MVEVPPMFSVPAAGLVNPPVPESAVLKVNVTLFVYVPLIVALGIEILFVPLNVLEEPASVYTPVPALNVPLFWIFPFTVTASLTVVLPNVPPLLTVKSPNVRLPAVPVVMFIIPEMLVVPVTARLKLFVASEPEVIVRLPLTVSAPPDVAEPVPLNVRFWYIKPASIVGL